MSPPDRAARAPTSLPPTPRECRPALPRVASAGNGGGRSGMGRIAPADHAMAHRFRNTHNMPFSTCRASRQGLPRLSARRCCPNSTKGRIRSHCTSVRSAMPLAIQQPKRRCSGYWVVDTGYWQTGTAPQENSFPGTTVDPKLEVGKLEAVGRLAAGNCQRD